ETSSASAARTRGSSRPVAAVSSWMNEAPRVRSAASTVSQTVSETASESGSQTVSETVCDTVCDPVCDTVCDPVCETVCDPGACGALQTPACSRRNSATGVAP